MHLVFLGRKTNALPEGDMALLEMAWEEAEEIAAIADNLTLLPEVIRQLVDRPPAPPHRTGCDSNDRRDQHQQ